jgi:hypothetical protein
MEESLFSFPVVADLVEALDGAGELPMNADQGG